VSQEFTHIEDVLEAVVKRTLGADELASALRVIDAYRAEVGHDAPEPEARLDPTHAGDKDAEIAALRAELAIQYGKSAEEEPPANPPAADPSPTGRGRRGK
jgi:hypothetical protein